MDVFSERVRYTVHMVDGNGNTGTVEVEVPEASETAAMRQAEFASATCSMAAWHATPWWAVRAERAPGAWMWATP